MSTRKHGQLTITLKSDLCVGSGYSFAKIVDSDTCYDEFGLPYIPAKRLRGCIRESIETILYQKYSPSMVEEVFGKRGDSLGSSLTIGNGYIEDYNGIREILAKGHVSSQEVLERFTHILGQTRIENGVADQGSLRFTRMVNHFSPINNEEMTFTSDVSWLEDENDNSVWQMIQDGTKATRHLGLNRNRGIGNIQIEAKASSEDSEKNTEVIKETMLNDGRVKLLFGIRNVQPLMLSKQNEDSSETYISGQQVLGLLVGRYLSENNSADSREFNDLFLNGKTQYSNLYPYDGKHICYPAPLYLNKLKKTKALVYTLMAELPRDEIKDGNQPKQLKGQYASIGTEGVKTYEVEKDIIYHHSHRNTHETEKGEEGILYSMEVIRKGQMFAGSITVPGEYKEMIKRLLVKDDLYFGKSKSSQYGRCELVACEDEKEVGEESYNAGDTIVVTFLSDTMICNERGIQTVYYDEVRSAVAELLGLPGAEENEGCLSNLQTATSTGYMSVWNLRRPTCPVIRAGSYLTYRLSGSWTAKIKPIGERTLEGYGQIRIDKAENYRFDSVRMAENIDNESNYEEVGSNARKAAERLLEPIIYEHWLTRKINSAINGENSISDSDPSEDTYAGRLALMLRESLDESKGDAKVAFSKFGKRVDSIKRDTTRKKGEKLLKRIGKKEKDSWTISSDDTIYMQSDGELKNELEEYGISDSNINDEKEKLWPRYIMAILTDRKYKDR